jgi:hypothetical protein
MRRRSDFCGGLFSRPDLSGNPLQRRPRRSGAVPKPHTEGVRVLVCPDANQNGSQCNRLTVQTRQQVPVYALKCEGGAAAPFRSSGFLIPCTEVLRPPRSRWENYEKSSKEWWLRQTACH